MSEHHIAFKDESLPTTADVRGILAITSGDREGK